MNPFKSFSQEELEKIKPIIEVLEKYYHIPGIVTDFKKECSSLHPYLKRADFWHNKIVVETDQHPATKDTPIGWISNTLGCILDYLEKTQSSTPTTNDLDLSDVSLDPHGSSDDMGPADLGNFGRVRDSPFQDPTDFICEGCNSTRGRWIVDESCNGKAIACRDCGKEIKRRHPWRDEVTLLRRSASKANEK